ncbi:MAG: peptidoglycan-binding protein [Candidatus Competibacteraceae bacterium]|nr:peptidoglycan-binding protein [Candidatus Competibacteraceae bacterium]
MRKAAREVLGVPGLQSKRGLRLSGLRLATGLAGITVVAVSGYLSYSALTVGSPADTASPAVVESLAAVTESPADSTVQEPVLPVVATTTPPAETEEQPISIPRITSSTALQTVLANAPVTENPLRQLLNLWGEGIQTVTGQVDCETIKANRLYCLDGRESDWTELRRYNRPALLQLNDAQGGGRQLLLSGLTTDTATVQIGAQAVQTALDSLAPLWTGDYLLLWRPQIAPTLIGPGSRGDAVVWLRQQLALAEGRSFAPDTLSTEFDPILQEQVRDFQRANNLEVDGLVGQRTMALLNTLSPTPDTPLLTASTKVQ